MARAGHRVDVRLSATRHLTAAEAGFRSAWAVTGSTPDRITTDGHEAGSVANFAQEAMKGQWPLSVWQLRGEGGELFGRGEALFNSRFKLPFAQHVHQLDAG